jgi:hypothetical protein
MINKLLAFLAFLVFSPVGDAINGYLKREEGNCWAAAVLSSDRMMFKCKNSIAVATITYMDMPQIVRAECAWEAMQGIRAMMTLKYILYTGSEIRPVSFPRENDGLHVQFLVDDEIIDGLLGTYMPPLFDGAQAGKWCE